MFKSLKIKSLFSFVFVLGSLTLSAQEKAVSDTELGQFADAYIQVQMQNQEAQNQMMGIIQAEGLELERFGEIQEATMDPSKASEVNADELKKHASATAKMEALQPELEKKAIASIESVGITLDQYKTLATAIQNEESLQQRLQDLLMARQGN